MKGKSFAKLTAFIVAVILFTFVFFTGIPLSRIAGVYDLDPTRLAVNFGLDLKGGVTVVLEATGEEEVTAEQLAQTAAVIRGRIDSLGVKEPVITTQGSRQIRVSLPDITDKQEALDTIGRTAKLTFEDPEGNVVVTGEMVTNAVATQVPDSAGLYKPAVQLTFNEEGSAAFAAATADLIGQAITIKLDEDVLSSPTVEQEITEGTAYITGISTQEEADRLAMLIRGGALPLDMAAVQVETVGSVLGQDSLSKSLVAGLVGILLVLAFMAVVYRIPGVTACIALCAYILIYLNAIAAFSVTLTLPGFAGIILSVGMAVDANVVIFERIKEEIRAGRALGAAVGSGFKLAMTSIIDSNLTTLIAGFALFSFGSGSVKGFALTLMLGVAISMFSALVITKRLLAWTMDAFGLKNAEMFVKTSKEAR